MHIMHSRVECRVSDFCSKSNQYSVACHDVHIIIPNNCIVVIPSGSYAVESAFLMDSEKATKLVKSKHTFLIMDTEM